MWYLDPEILRHVRISRKDEFYRISSFDNEERVIRGDRRREELIREFFYIKLISIDKYPKNKIELQYPIQIGSSKRYADIVVMNNEDRPQIIIETKWEIDNEARGQLASYVSVKRARYGILADIHKIQYFRSNDGELEEISAWPLSELLNESLIEAKPSDSKRQLFESLSMTPRGNAILTFDGKPLSFQKPDLSSYTKIKRLAWANYSILLPDLSNKSWENILRQLHKQYEDTIPYNPSKEASTSDGIQALTKLLSAIPAGDERTLGEYLEIALLCGTSLSQEIRGQMYDHIVPEKADRLRASAVLTRYGLRVRTDPKRGCFLYIAGAKIQAIAEIMRREPNAYPDNYLAAILSHPKAQKTKKAATYGLKGCGYEIEIPKDAIIEAKTDSEAVLQTGK